jgi:uncharacterized protein YneF (UPF0154 family)
MKNISDEMAIIICILIGLIMGILGTLLIYSIYLDADPRFSETCLDDTKKKYDDMMKSGKYDFEVATDYHTNQIRCNVKEEVIKKIKQDLERN